MKFLVLIACALVAVNAGPAPAKVQKKVAVPMILPGIRGLKPIVKAPQADLCLVCQLGMNALHGMLSDPGMQGNIHTLLYDICNALPAADQSICKQIVDTDFAQIYQALLGQLTADNICVHVTHVCTSTKIMFQGAKFDSCEVCTDVASTLDYLLQESFVDNELASVLSDACSALPASFSSTCQTIVTQYGPELLKCAASLLTPAKVCDTVGLCSSKAHSKDLFGICDTLQQIYNGVAGLVQEASAVCSVIPDQSLQQSCQQIFQQYSGQLTSMAQGVLQELATLIDCQLTTRKIAKSAKSIMKPNSIECAACKAVFGFVEDDLLTSTNEGTVLQGIEQVCTYIPNQQWQTQCDGIVQKYGDAIFKQLQASLQPNSVCSMMNMCASSSKFMKKIAVKKIVPKIV